MSVLETLPRFLYPSSRQFPFDEVTEKIVRAIERRNWKVPGITVEFDIYGSGEAKFQKVRSITGDNFKLYFCRIQGRASDRWNDTAAVHSICIPKQILEVYEDESGPTYYLYVGEDWEADKEWFMNSIKVSAKLYNEPRRYLRYGGDTYRRRATVLLPENDLDREYSPEGKEPVRINLELKFMQFTSWLEKNVLGYILSFPVAKTIQLNHMPMEELVPYKGPWKTVYSMCDGRDAERIKKGKENPNELPHEERHAYIGDGHRLVHLSVPCEGRFPEIAYEGFIWCDVIEGEEVSQKSKLAHEVRNAMGYGFGTDYIVAINLKYSNQVYVADNSKYKEARLQIFADIAPRERLTDEELGNACAARAATIIPITEYKGNYKEPIVLINRELEFEEIEKIILCEN